ncbi:MAG: 2Fe-2S iron-sulfur cluster-binding protein [Acidimicrobiia bacterium]
MTVVSDRLEFTLDDQLVVVAYAPGETLLTVLRERLGVTSVKDGCAPQGQCGCCTVLVDGDPRVACVTPAARIAGREVRTVATVPGATDLAEKLCATGGAQCGFCTPGIIVRLAAKQPTSDVAIDRALAGHLCRCTGWETIREALRDVAIDPERDWDAAAERAQLELGAPQRVGVDIALGHGAFADDSAPRDALVAVPLPPGSDAPFVEVAGARWVVGATLAEARERAGKIQGRATTQAVRPPIGIAWTPTGGVGLSTSWTEPAYLEPDASWCAPDGTPAPVRGNGGAFGGKRDAIAADVAHALADAYGEPVRVVYAREDVVRTRPKRPPIAAIAHWEAGTVHLMGQVVLDASSYDAWMTRRAWSYAGVTVEEEWDTVSVPGPTTSMALRASGLAERTVLICGALHAAGQAIQPADEREGQVLLDTLAGVPESGALAGARVHTNAGGRINGVDVRVAAGDPLDWSVLRSYAIGAAHAALSWVTSEGIAVDPSSGEILDLTIRSFGVLRPKDTPCIDVTVVEDSGAPRARSSDAVFSAVAAAAWNAIADATGQRPMAFPTGVLPVRETEDTV